MKYYVYTVLDENKNVVYVGKGSGNRFKSVSGRTKEFRDFLSKNIHETLIVKDKLSEQEAFDLELQIYNEKKPEFNKKIPCSAKVLTYEFCNEWFYLCNSSVSNLRYKKDLFSGSFNQFHKIVKDSEVCSKTNGYYASRIKNNFCYAHRIVYSLLHKIDIPQGLVINHIDSNGFNNRPSNLELCTQRKNTAKSKLRYDSKSKIKGLFFSKSEVCYCYITHLGTRYIKGFSCKKYGKEKAVELAIKWLNEKKNILDINNSYL